MFTCWRAFKLTVLYDTNWFVPLLLLLYSLESLKMILVVRMILMMVKTKVKIRRAVVFMCLLSWQQSIMVSACTYTLVVTNRWHKFHYNLPYLTDGDETPMTRQQKQLDRAKKRALQSSVMQELREEYMETPTEITQTSVTQTVLSRQHKEKEE